MKYLDYDLLIQKHKWILSEELKAVISPDFDGIVSGLLMNNYLNWQIVGFYDGKILAIDKEYDYKNCVFLDMEIFEKGVKSIGHHMLCYNKNKIYNYFINLENCINPNNLRNYDTIHNFSKKYPFGTIHLLICILGQKFTIDITRQAITAMLYADGTFKNLFNYPENCIDWLTFLKVKDENSKLYKIFLKFKNRKIANTIHDLEIIFKKFNLLKYEKIRGDKISLPVLRHKSISYLKNIEETLKTIAEMTNLEYKPDFWPFYNINSLTFTDYNKQIADKINSKIYEKILQNKPFSFANTGRSRIEYTLR